jgi:hypothetical protein
MAEPTAGSRSTGPAYVAASSAGARLAARASRYRRSRMFAAYWAAVRQAATAAPGSPSSSSRWARTPCSRWWPLRSRRTRSSPAAVRSLWCRCCTQPRWTASRIKAARVLSGAAVRSPGVRAGACLPCVGAGTSASSGGPSHQAARHSAASCSWPAPAASSSRSRTRARALHLTPVGEVCPECRSRIAN